MSANGPLRPVGTAQANVGFRGHSRSRRRALEATLLTQNDLACWLSNGVVQRVGFDKALSRVDILIEPEEIVGIVLAFHHHETIVVFAVGGFHPIWAFIA
jgi:hypothetical protein